MDDISKFLLLGIMVCSIMYLMYLYMEWSVVGWNTLTLTQYANAKLRTGDALSASIDSVNSSYTSNLYNFEPLGDNSTLLKNTGIIIGLPPKYIVDAYIPFKIKWLYAVIELKAKYFP
jgi:hypothetical protein